MFKKIKSFLGASKEDSKRTIPFIAIISLLIIVTTTFMALFYAYFREKKPEDIPNEIEIALNTSNGIMVASDKMIETRIADSKLIKIFHQLLATKTLAETPPSLTDTPNYILQYKYGETTAEYSCYFDSSYDQSYLKDKKGNVFILQEDIYNDFLNSTFSQNAYPESKIPTLMTGDGDKITPTEATWNYTKQDGTKVPASVILADKNNIQYTISGAILLAFDHEPDSCVAQIYDELGKQIYHGSLEELAFVNTNTDTTFKARITATWEDRDDSLSYGKAIYNFNITISTRAEISISSHVINSGEFLVVSIKNAPTLSKIIYSTNPDLDTVYNSGKDENIGNFDSLYKYKPTFIKSGTGATAIIPFPADTPSGKFNFSVSYGAALQNFIIEIEKLPQEQVTISRPAEEISPMVSEASKKSLNDTLTNLSAPVQNDIFFRDYFISLEAYGFGSGYSFTNEVMTEDELIRFNAIGKEYLCATPGGRSVPALNLGIVLEAGYCHYLGNYVVIDHGLGIRTWYCGLSDFNVKKGDIVAKGDLIGKTGSSSLMSGNGVILMCSIYDVIIDPYAIEGKSIRINDN